MGRNNKYQMIVGGLLGLFMQSCTLSDTLPSGGSGGGEDAGGPRYAVTFAPLTIDEGGEQTRAAQPLAQGKLRLMVYGSYDDLTSKKPIANLLYDVTDGVLTLANTEPAQTPLELPLGEYRFYALVPSDKLDPQKGVTGSIISHGDDPLASRTPVTISTQAVYVMLNPLTHKTSRVEFVIARGKEATYKTLEQPSRIVLYSQTNDPVPFSLGEGGGSLSVPQKAETDTVCMQAVSPTDVAETFRAERLVLPRPMSDFMIAVDTRIDTGDGPKPCTLRGRIFTRMFDPGRYYHFRLLVNDPAEGGDIVLLVTDWNSFGWDDNMGGSGTYISVGKWDKITYNDDIG